jgi:hypothetical protein
MLKKDASVRITLYKLCDMPAYTHDLDIYLRKDKTHTTTDMAATYVTGKTWKYLYMNIFLLPDLFIDLKEIN